MASLVAYPVIMQEPVTRTAQLTGAGFRALQAFQRYLRADLHLDLDLLLHPITIHPTMPSNTCSLLSLLLPSTPSLKGLFVFSTQFLSLNWKIRAAPLAYVS